MDSQVIHAGEPTDPSKTLADVSGVGVFEITFEANVGLGGKQVFAPAKARQPLDSIHGKLREWDFDRLAGLCP
jgi:hypothetical protein